MVSLSNHEAPHHGSCNALMVRQAHHEGLTDYSAAFGTSRASQFGFSTLGWKT